MQYIVSNRTDLLSVNLWTSMDLELQGPSVANKNKMSPKRDVTLLTRRAAVELLD